MKVQPAIFKTSKSVQSSSPMVDKYWQDLLPNQSYERLQIKGIPQSVIDSVIGMDTRDAIFEINRYGFRAQFVYPAGHDNKNVLNWSEALAGRDTVYYTVGDDGNVAQARIGWEKQLMVVKEEVKAVAA